MENLSDIRVDTVVRIDDFRKRDGSGAGVRVQSFRDVARGTLPDAAGCGSGTLGMAPGVSDHRAERRGYGDAPRSEQTDRLRPGGQRGGGGGR